ncbi:MAG: hypothetical protein BM564_08835 [Bacteroidetes bacterium MedPE-SWsnd-G2]|nr:MAG: hypothetical protein BM564_08835 [Bacteroidetes bacterium MedPE-SWsnd-G2]
MKKFVFTCLLLCTSATVFSQAAIIALIFGDKVATENFNIGLEIGGSFKNVSNLEGSNMFLGMNFGISGNIKFNDHWSLHPTAYFLSQKGGKLDRFSLMTDNPELNSEFQNVPTELKLDYIDVPVVLNYRFTNSNFKIGLGPMVSFLTKSHAVYENQFGKFDHNISQWTHKTEWSAMFNVGYIYYSKKKQKEIHFLVQYVHGFSDVYRDVLFSGDNRNHYFGMTLSFPFIKKD